MAENTPKTKILELINDGTLSAEEGLRLINAMEQPMPEPEAVPQQAEVDIKIGDVNDTARHIFTEEEKEKIRKFRNWWIIPFCFGILTLFLASFWMIESYQLAGLGWGFWLSWIPLFIAIALMVLSWLSRTARVLHIKVKEYKEGGRVSFSANLPLPIKLSKWALFRFGGSSEHRMQFTHILNQINEDVTPDNPLFVEVHGKDGDVEIFIV